MAGVPRLSLCEKLGGEKTLHEAVERLYVRILTDPQISPFFPYEDIDSIKKHQRAFLSLAFGGPNHYTGRVLSEAHASSVQAGLNDSHFDAVKEHFAQVLHELDIDPGLIQESLEIIETARQDVLGRSQF